MQMDTVFELLPQIVSCILCMSVRTLTRPEVIKIFSCSTQLNMNFFLPIIVGILTFMSWENSIIGLSEPEKRLNFLIYLYL